jgi:hypothetical protein
MIQKQIKPDLHIARARLADAAIRLNDMYNITQLFTASYPNPIRILGHSLHGIEVLIDSARDIICDYVDEQNRKVKYPCKKPKSKRKS